MIAEVAPVWFTARAAGVAALLLASISVAFGLLLATRVLPKRIGGPESKAVHEALSLATMATIGIHGLALVFDPVLNASLAQLLVPFASPYRALGTALGQLAGYGMVAFGLTYYVRGRIGPARWRKAHRLVPVFWLMGVGHGLLVGTDQGEPWFLAALAPPVLVALYLLIFRWTPEGSSTASRPLAPTPGARPGGSPAPRS